MYYTDSPSRTMSVFDFASTSGAISNRRTFFKVPDSLGEDCVPDGCAMDAEGYLWIAIHAGGKILRVSPKGEVVGEVDLPKATKITCPAFCGDDFDELFITTMEEGDGIADGQVFKVKVGIKGLDKNRFRMEE
jgi:sugar lactone lactonase YvrE